jgi:hypothetical protein
MENAVWDPGNPGIGTRERRPGVSGDSGDSGDSGESRVAGGPDFAEGSENPTPKRLKLGGIGEKTSPKKRPFSPSSDLSEEGKSRKERGGTVHEPGGEGTPPPAAGGAVGAAGVAGVAGAAGRGTTSSSEVRISTLSFFKGFGPNMPAFFSTDSAA